MNPVSLDLSTKQGVCVGARVLVALAARAAPADWMPTLGKAALVPGLGFALVWATGSNPRGVFRPDRRAWWVHLRPLHGLLWLGFAGLAHGPHQRRAWVALAADALAGAGAFLVLQPSTPT